MVNFELQKAKKKIRQAIDGKYAQKTTTTVAAAVGTRHVAIDGNLASATLPDGSSGAVEVINAGRLASARYELRTGGTVSVVSGGGGGSGGGSGISFSEADTRYYTKSQLDIGQLDIRYYTEAELDGGQLDTRYYTETESDARFLPLKGSAQYQIPVTGSTPFTAAYTALSSFAGSGLAFSAGFNVGAGTLITVNSNDVALANGTAQYQVPVTGATPFTPAYTALSAFAGNGLTFGSSFAVGVANTGAAGLSVEADAVRLTSSAAPGAAASILASDATGKLTLPLFTATTNVTTPALTSTGTLAITSGGTSNITLDSAGDQISIKSANRIGTDNYVSQATGWGIDYAGGADFRYLYVDEMHAKVFVADIEQALAGGQIICKSVCLLSQPFTAPAAGGVDFLQVYDLPSAPGMPLFQDNDIVRVRKFSRSGGSLTISDCWGIVQYYVNAGGGEQNWMFTRSSAPNAGSMAAGTVVPVDTVILDYGVSGNGFYEVNAIDGAYGVNSPYAQIARWTGHPATGTVINGRFGKLSGLSIGVANEMGIAVGNGFTTGDEYFKASNVGVIQNNVDSGWYNSGTKIVVINTAKGIDINAFGTGYDAVRSYSFSDGTTYRGGLQAYLNAGETQVKMHSLGPGVASIATVLAENTATNATAQVSIAATNSQTSRTASISLIASSAAYEVDVSADLIALSANKIHITNGTAADGSASAPILSFLNDPNTGIYRPGADQIGIATGGAQRVLIGNSTITLDGQIIKTGVAGQYETLRLGGGGAGVANANYIAFYDQAGTTRQAYIGLGSTTTYNVSVASDLGDVVVSAGAATLAVGKSGMTAMTQSSTTAAMPTLLLGQADLSEEFIEFSGTVAAGYPIDTAALGSYYGKVRVSVNGTFKWLALYN